MKYSEEFRPMQITDMVKCRLITASIILVGMLASCDPEPLPDPIRYTNCFIIKDVDCGDDEHYATCGNFHVYRQEDALIVAMDKVVDVISVHAQRMKEIPFEVIDVGNSMVVFKSPIDIDSSYIIQLKIIQ